MNQDRSNGPADVGVRGSINITIDELVQATVCAMMLQQDAMQVSPRPTSPSNVRNTLSINIPSNSELPALSPDFTRET